MLGVIEWERRSMVIYMIDYLEKVAIETEIELSESQLQQFQIFYDFLIETNQSFNLTAITEEKEVVQKHFIDSILLSKYIDLKGSRIIDVGTGAGFPGIPLAILYPDTKFVLMDSLLKKLKFIDAACDKCGIGNVETVHGRAEDIGKNQNYREKFDYCVSRAVASLPTLLELCIPLCKVKGQFASYKSELLNEELGKAKFAMKELNCTLKKKYNYTIPDTDFYRVFAIFEKQGKTKVKYPRQAGTPKRNPL